MYLHAEGAQTDADLRQVQSALLVQRLRRERGSVGDSVFLYQLAEHGDALSLPHDPHCFDLRHLKCLVVPVYLAWTQLVDQPAANVSITTIITRP